ncbi:MAG: PEP/pyruvate-binding domain-containing protein [Pseudomonadota bacterium]
MSELILAFTADDDSLESFGVKGRSLIQLIRPGLPVPDGFIVTAHAYRQHIKHAQLQTRILKLAHPQISAGKASFDEASAKIQDLFAQSPLSGDLQQAILQAYDRFMPQGATVAVRSSANAEDLPDMSFAGQQDTYLNISGPTQLINAIHRCWASLWTARALNYRNHMGIDHDQVAMAVVVQRMANAEVSGVLFTANPTTGARDKGIRRINPISASSARYPPHQKQSLVQYSMKSCDV